MPRIILSIGGGHVTGIRETVSYIKVALSEAFVNTQISVVDLDQLLEDKPRSFSDKDYDFEQIYQQLSSQQDTDQWEAVLLCGAYALFNDKINQLSQLKVFLDSDGDKRLIDLIHRRNATTPEKLTVCIDEYMDHLRPEMQKFIEPTKSRADLIIPSSSGSVGSAIIVDSIVKIVQDNKGGSSQTRKLFPHLDFQAERLDIEKEKYYDLS